MMTLAKLSKLHKAGKAPLLPGSLLPEETLRQRGYVPTVYTVDLSAERETGGDFWQVRVSAVAQNDTASYDKRLFLVNAEFSSLIKVIDVAVMELISAEVKAGSVVAEVWNGGMTTKESSAVRCQTSFPVMMWLRPGEDTRL